MKVITDIKDFNATVTTTCCESTLSFGVDDIKFTDPEWFYVKCPMCGYNYGIDNYILPSYVKMYVKGRESKKAETKGCRNDFTLKEEAEFREYQQAIMDVDPEYDLAVKIANSLPPAIVKQCFARIVKYYNGLSAKQITDIFANFKETDKL